MTDSVLIAFALVYIASNFSPVSGAGLGLNKKFYNSIFTVAGFAASRGCSTGSKASLPESASKDRGQCRD